MENLLEEGQEIDFKIDGLEGSGIIRGVSTTLPIMGAMYIVETSDKISEVYPYTAFVCPACYITHIY